MNKNFRNSICAYCGCGCKLQFEVENGEIKSIRPVPEDYASLGKPCIKGLSLHETLRSNRLTSPQIRKEGKLEDVSWDEAYTYIYEKMKVLGNDEVYFLASGELSNEDNYLMSKFARVAFESNNIDCCARLCHAATAKAFNEMFGIAAIPKYDFTDLEKCDLFLMIGTDPKADYPTMYHRIKKAKDYGAKIIILDVGPSTTSEDADSIIKISPNGIVPLLSRLMERIIEGRDFTKDAKLREGYDDLVRDISKITDRFPLNATNLKDGDFEDLYYLVNHSKHPAILYGMGATQQHNGTQNVKAIASLSILLNAVLFSNRGKINVQGAGDVGGFPGFRPSESKYELFEKYWGIKPGEEHSFMNHDGKVATEALYENDVKAVWVMASNPAHSMPDLNALEKSLKDKFVIYQHHHPGVTMEFADVVLPTTMLPEESGTITNGERRVRRVEPLHHDPMVKPSWQIIVELARKFGFEKLFNYESPRKVYDEIKEIIPAYSDLDDKVVDGMKGDLADKEPKFINFPRLRYELDKRDLETYPYVMTTARARYHFCTGEGTRNSERLMKLDPGAEAIFNPSDAKELGLKEGDMVKIESSVGELEIGVEIDDLVERKVVVLPYHFEKHLVNKLTPRNLDPESGTPCYKEINVKISPVV